MSEERRNSKVVIVTDSSSGFKNGEPTKLLETTLKRLGVALSDCSVIDLFDVIEDQLSLHEEILRLRAPGGVVISLGTTALQILKSDPKVKITAARGKVFQAFYDVEVLPTFHPAAVLRSPGSYFKMFLADLRYALSLIDGGCVRKPIEPEYEVVTTEGFKEWFQKFLANFDKSANSVIAADIETTGLNPFKDDLLCLGLALAPERVSIITEELLITQKDAFQFLFHLLTRARWLWHNGKFDTKFLHLLGYESARCDEDTMLLHYALDETKGTHGLKELAAELLGAEEYESEVKKYVNQPKGYRNVPKEQLYKYLAKDVSYTLQIHQKLLEKADSTALKLYYSMLMPASEFLKGVELKGIHIDQDHIHSLRTELEADESRVLGNIEELVGKYWEPEKYIKDTGAKKAPEKFSPNSPKQVNWMMYRRMRLKPPRGFKPSTDKEILSKFLETISKETIVGQFLTLMLELRKVQKMLSTYVKGILEQTQADGRVHQTYLIHGTVTGRLSSSEPNVQNIPREARIRNIFNAAPGKILVEADYSQAELRVLAHLSGDEFLKEVYRNGRDLHDEVSIQMFGENFTKEQRMRAKAINFGIAYGRGAQSLVFEFGMSYREAQDLIDKWFEKLPTAQKYLESCERFEKKRLETLFGRRRRFGLIASSNLKAARNEAKNFAIQSIASDLTLLAAQALNHYFISSCSHKKISIVNLVHDSILLEVDDDYEVVRYVLGLTIGCMKETAESTLKCDFPFAADAKIGYSWGTMKALPVNADFEMFKEIKAQLLEGEK